MDGPHQLGKVQSSSSSTGCPWPGPPALVVPHLPEQAGRGVVPLCAASGGVLHLAVWQGEVTLLREGGVQALLDELPKGRLVAERALSQPVVLF